jgi:hypothetical protein
MIFILVIILAILIFAVILASIIGFKGLLIFFIACILTYVGGLILFKILLGKLFNHG